MKPGRVIILNGPSSSGKTSIARALQAAWATPLLLVGLDTVIGMLPFHYTGDGAAAALGYHVRAAGSTARYDMGPLGRRMNLQLARLAATLCDDGFDVVVDHVIADDGTLRDLVAALDPARTYLIGVTCSPEIAAARERARGDRVIGLAASQARAVHAGRQYDMMLDTSDAAASGLAAAIVALVEARPPA